MGCSGLTPVVGCSNLTPVVKCTSLTPVVGCSNITLVVGFSSLTLVVGCGSLTPVVGCSNVVVRTSREPGFESTYCQFKAWTILFPPCCLSSLSCINEYLPVDSGGYIAVIAGSMRSLTVHSAVAGQA